MILTACSCKGGNRLKAVDYVSSKSILRFCLDIPGTLSKNSLGHRYGAQALNQSIQGGLQSYNEVKISSSMALNSEAARTEAAQVAG